MPKQIIQGVVFVNVTSGDLDLTLLPCPFCGSSAVELSNTWTASYHVECEDCGAEGPSSTRRTTARGNRSPKVHREAALEAAERWQTRSRTP